MSQPRIHLAAVRIALRLPVANGRESRLCAGRNGNHASVDHQRAAELQAMLEGGELPARKRDLVAYARREDEGAVHELRRLRDREYQTLDEVGEELIAVQPQSPRMDAVPHEESDLPPGGIEYLNPHPQSGAVRPDAPPDNPPQKALQQQTEAQQRQAERQKQLG